MTKKKNAKIYIHIQHINKNLIICILKMDGLNLCSSESRLDFVILECQLISSFLNAKYHVAVDEGR